MRHLSGFVLFQRKSKPILIRSMNKCRFGDVIGLFVCFLRLDISKPITPVTLQAEPTLIKIDQQR